MTTQSQGSIVLLLIQGNAKLHQQTSVRCVFGKQEIVPLPIKRHFPHSTTLCMTIKSTPDSPSIALHLFLLSVPSLMILFK